MAESTTTPNAALSIWRLPLGRLTLGLTFVVAATAFEALAVATILPTSLRELGGLEFYGWTFSAFMLTNLIGISVGGSASDRVGPYRVFLTGMLLLSGGLIVSGFAPAMVVIVAGRTLQGFGAGLLSAVVYASIAQAYPVDTQPRMLATLSSAWVVPGLIGPGLAGLIAEHASWRWVFLGLVPLLLLASALVLPALRALAIADTTSPDRALAAGRTWLSVQLGVGAGTALVGLGDSHWQLALTLLLAGAAIGGRALQRLMPAGTLLARAGLPAAIATMALLNFAFFGTEAFVPLALSRVRDAPVWLSGSSLTAAALTWTLGAWLPVRLAGHFRRRAIISVGLAIVSAGIAGTACVLLPSVPPAYAVIAWGVTGLGMGLAFTTTSAAILEAAAPGEAGLASAGLQLAQVLGAALATGAGGAIVSARFAGDPPVVGIAVVDALMLTSLALAMLAARGVAQSDQHAPQVPAHVART